MYCFIVHVLYISGNWETVTDFMTSLEQHFGISVFAFHCSGIHTVNYPPTNLQQKFVGVLEPKDLMTTAIFHKGDSLRKW